MPTAAIARWAIERLNLRGSDAVVGAAAARMILMRRLLVTVVLASLACVATAQPAPGAQRVPTVTRLVKLFSELEIALNDRIAAKDAAAIARTLDAGFEARNADTPGTPIPRDEWMRLAVVDPARSARIDQMAVHDFGTVAVVSFRQVDEAAQASASHRERFIVDCWMRAGERWMLAVRYVGVGTTSPATQRKRARSRTIEKR